MYIIGIDLGGTKIEAILVKNDILQPIKKKRIPTESEQGYDAILQKIVKLVLGARLRCYPAKNSKISIRMEC